MRQPQGVAVEAGGAIRVADVQGDLTQAADPDPWRRGHGALLVCECGAGRAAGPAPERDLVGHVKLRSDVPDVIADGALARAEVLRDLPAGEAVSHPVHDGPLGRGEHVGVPRSPRSRSRHSAQANERIAEFPYPCAQFATKGGGQDGGAP